MHYRSFVICIASIVFLGATDPVFANRNGALSGHTGSPSSFGKDCTNCHFGGETAGSVSLEGVPSAYEFNKVYNLIIRVSDPDGVGAGFQISAENSQGSHLGTLMVADAVHTQLTPDSPSYATHTEAGVDDAIQKWASNGKSATFFVQWKAPATDVGPVTFWAAGNAIDDNFLPFDDSVYVTSMTIPAQPDCDDGVTCTVDTFENGKCVHTPNPALCPGDGIFCNGVETCHPTQGCISPGNPCGAGTVCNEAADSCDALGCATSADCNDGLFCNGQETCVNSTCIGGSSPCAASQICIEATDQCVSCAAHTDCDDGVFCNGAEVCVNGSCAAGADPCAGGSVCDESAKACKALSCTVDADCIDDKLCNGVEFCKEGTCQPGPPPCPEGLYCDESSGTCVVCITDGNCDDGLPCTLNFCVEGNCTVVPDDALCDDGVFCNGAERCDAVFGCVASAQQPCAPEDFCNEQAAACEACEASAACNDGDPCTDGDQCVNGVCAGTPVENCCTQNEDCDDHDDCTTDTCTNHQCVHALAPECLDEDLDGISDGLDLCPGTSPGAVVDGDGCSCEQLDSDQDGVNGCEDLCPDTPDGDAVDATGCPVVPLPPPPAISEDIDTDTGAPVPDENANDAAVPPHRSFCGMFGMLQPAIMAAGLWALSWRRDRSSCWRSDTSEAPDA